GDSARIKVQRILAATSPSDTLYPQIVYTQAMVANDAGEMRRQLQRVAVEYPSSSWADDALLRLVQLDYASANLDGAARNLERIRLDYPGSTLLPQAAYWAGRTYFDQKKPDLACRWIADGMAGSRGNVELQNQLGYLNQRCSQLVGAGPPPPTDSQPGIRPPLDSQPTIARAPQDTAPAPVSRTDTVRLPRTPSPAPVTPAARFRVQITAVRSASAAQAIASKINSRGFKAVVTEEGGLYKVRVGEYATKAEAVAAVPAIKAKLGGSPFVVAES
ncbi:MAG TPA: SPOR domain-containing protein, partial [Gemmatimonadales bacterium]